MHSDILLGEKNGAGDLGKKATILLKIFEIHSKENVVHTFTAWADSHVSFYRQIKHRCNSLFLFLFSLKHYSYNFTLLVTLHWFLE